MCCWADWLLVWTFLGTGKMVDYIWAIQAVPERLDFIMSNLHLWEQEDMNVCYLISLFKWLLRLLNGELTWQGQDFCTVASEQQTHSNTDVIAFRSSALGTALCWLRKLIRIKTSKDKKANKTNQKPIEFKFQPHRIVLL